MGLPERRVKDAGTERHGAHQEVPELGSGERVGGGGERVREEGGGRRVETVQPPGEVKESRHCRRAIALCLSRSAITWKR